MLLAALLAIDMAGCASIQKKFTRKKKEQPKAPRIYQVQKYQKKPTAELYQKHYAFFTSWQSEAMAVLGNNHKKDVQCMEQMVTNLIDMQSMLVPEKAQGLDKSIKRLKTVRDIVIKENLSQYNKTYTISTVDREGRFVKREYTFNKVKNFMKDSFDETAKQAEEDGA
jgi:hypothetical protein